MEKGLHSWSMPEGSSVYKPGCFGSLFDHHPMLTIDGTISLKNCDTTLLLLKNAQFSESLRKKTSKKQKKQIKTCYLHVGLVQVGVKPLARQCFDASIILCLRDSRFLEFRKSLLGLVESTLKAGPIYFNCYANLLVPLSDPNLERVLTVNVVSTAIDEAMSGVEPLSLSYRVYYKILSRPYGDRALKESPLGKTKLFQADVKSNSVVSKIIEWEQVQIPGRLVEQVTTREEDQSEQQRAGRYVNIPRPRFDMFKVNFSESRP